MNERFRCSFVSFRFRDFKLLLQRGYFAILQFRRTTKVATAFRIGQLLTRSIERVLDLG